MTAIVVLFLRGAAAETFARKWRHGDPREPGYYPLMNAALAIAEGRRGWWGRSSDDRRVDP